MGFGWRWWRFPYERSVWCSDHEQARRWYEALERQGVEQVREQVRAVLARGAGPRGSIPISTEASVTIGFCQEWLSWKDRRKGSREDAYRRRQIGLMITGVVVTILVAIFGWYFSK
jgi:hypothetical protein